MTAAVDPRLIADINTIRPPCQVIDFHTGQLCEDPAAWNITWTPRAAFAIAQGPTPWCIHHKAALDRHRQHCTGCTAAWDITAVEL